MNAADRIIRWENHPDYNCGREEAYAFIQRRNDDGLTIGEISAELGMSAMWIRDVMKRLGIESHYGCGITKRKNHRKKISDEQVRAIRSDRHKTNRQWANELDAHITHIYAIRKGRYRRDVK